MTQNNDLIPKSVRAWLYPLAAVVLGTALTFRIVTQEQLAAWFENTVFGFAFIGMLIAKLHVGK